jgi:3-oxoacyl-[acyl-carrier protein] reductase
MTPTKSRVTVVTGSTRGLGRVTAQLFADDGDAVVVNSRNADEGERVAAEIGAGAVSISGDIATAEGCVHLVEETVARFGRIDVLVNNAGTMSSYPALDFPVDEWQRIMDINLTGPFMLCQLAGRQMFAQGKGAIVNVGSVSGITTPPLRLAYVTAKAGLLAMTKALAAEWSPTVRVNMMMPGVVETELLAQLTADKIFDPTSALTRTPYGRFGQPIELARAVRFLASDDASYIAGAVLPVDGAWLVSGQNR